MKVSLCSGCTASVGTDLTPALSAALKQAGISASVERVACMSGCARPLTVAFRDAGKVAYLFGDLSEADLDALITFARLYAASTDGAFADARPLGALRFKALARIPG